MYICKYKWDLIFLWKRKDVFSKIIIFPHMHIIMWEFSKKNSTFFREKDHQPFFSAHTRKKYWLEWEVRIISQGDAVKLNKSYCITDRHICLAIFKTEILMMRKVDLRSFYMSEKILKQVNILSQWRKCATNLFFFNLQFTFISIYIYI